ncbi:hypothetical protein AMAG_02147 [Allomyces macrogynus ATCC 38327]|uniref:Uncharacterized protein n=1 Tax=Allomyces macrogynus (strain ATCC 38327) TaxID=578462 RepID=A0A0L0S1A4_ALLM3|nr:hypothetical protein AMAG_02147 [Allomyces macrogynus ATCC 38327]|eukprot:KNE56328.1 hypothetical protein AMAG_02147 [Allomyces macrogynus ATCC 38327]
MNASLDALDDRTKRLLCKYASNLPSVDDDPSAGGGKSGAAAMANTALVTSHLYRLFPLTYPAANLKLLLALSDSGRVRLDIRVVAVNELGLHPRKTLPPRPVKLFATLRSGTARGGQLVESTIDLSALRACLTSVSPAFLDAESGKGMVRVEIDAAGLCGLFESLPAPGNESVFVQITTDFEDCLGVMIGPFGVNRSDEDVVDVFRRFIVSRDDGVEDELLIREEWGFGIPGKVWDSAVFVGRALPHLLHANPSITTALDLSSGTGFLAAVVSTVHQSCTVYCTDVPDALDLMHGNCAGRANIHVGSLWWGGPLHVDGQFAAPVPLPAGPVDLLVCSDVLYETEFFDPLWTTIVGSVRRGGVVVFGYKSRGLTVAEEDVFFDRMATAFDVEAVMPLGFRFGVIVIVYRKRS